MVTLAAPVMTLSGIYHYCSLFALEACLCMKLSLWGIGLKIENWVLTFKDDGVAFEDLELVHLSLGHLDDRVVVLLRVFDLQLVRCLLAIHDRCREVLRFSATHIVLSEKSVF